jgi:ribosomal protein L25 (general stress protein Ctc)
MKTVLASLAVFSLIATSSYAMDWIIVPGAKVDGDIICLDRDNVVKDKEIISAWIKRFKEGGNYSKTLIEFDCAKKKTKMVKMLEFDKATNVTTTVDFEPVWEASAPETPAQAAALMICKKSKGFNPALVSMKQKQ